MLVAVILIGVLMSVAFGLGVAADGGTFSAGWGHPYGGVCHPVFRALGLAFGLLILIAIAGVIACALRGPGHYAPSGYPGPFGRHRRYWREEAWRDEIESAIDEWHRRAHGAAGDTGPTPPAAEPPAAPGGKVK
jgi:hypothetical protein